MAEAVLAVAALLVLAVAVAALRAVLDGRRVGTPASIAVLAPVAEGARLLRTRRVRAGALPVLAGTLLLGAAVLRVLVPWIAGPVGVGGFVVADAVWWLGGLLLAERRGRFLLGAIAVAAPLTVSLAVPVVAARSIGVDAVVAAQRTLPFGAEAPVAGLLALAIGGVLMPWAVQGEAHRLGGVARLLAGAGLAAQPVSAAATASVLFLGVGGGRLLAASALLALVLLVAARRFPALRLPRLARPALLVLLPFAVVQLAVLTVLTVLGG